LLADARHIVDSRLVGLLARARLAWPELMVSDEAFAAAVTSAVGDAPDIGAAIDERAIEDLYLAQACATGATPALAAFGVMCDAALRAGLRQMNLADDVIDDVLHEVRTKLFVAMTGAPKILSYSGRAALKSWTRTVATRIAVDRLRAREATTSEDDVLEHLADSADDPELAHLRTRYTTELKLAFEAALATLDVRERNVLRHHFIDRLTLDEVGALYGVHKATASRWLEAARTALSKRTRAHFQGAVHVMPSELESIMRLVQSHVDLSLSRVLA